MENENLKEIIELINDYYKKKLITDEDFIAIIEHCLKTSNYNSDFKDLNVFSLESILSTIIPDGDKYIAKFDSEANLKKHKTKLELSIHDLKNCYDNNSNLDVYFDDNGNGELKISLNPSQYNQRNSIALKAIDDYSKSNNENGFPTKITILYTDIKEIYEILNANKNAKAILNTAVSLSNNDNYKGRVSLVLVLDTGAKTNTYYDTFCLRPPDNC